MMRIIKYWTDDKDIVNNTILLTIGQYVSSTLGFLTIVISARLLGPDQYGVAVMLAAYPSLLLSLASFKSVTVTTRYLAGFRSANKVEKLQAVCKLGYEVDFLAFSFPLVVTALTGGWIVHHILGLSSRMFWLMMVYAASFLFLSFRGTSYAVLIAFEEFRLLSLLYATERALIFIGVVTLVSMGFGVAGKLYGVALGNVLFGLISLVTGTFILSRNKIPPWWKAPVKSIETREVFSSLGWNYLTATLNGLITQVPLMLLGKFRNPEEAGFYSLATSLASISSHLRNAAEKVFYSRLSARWGKGEGEETFSYSIRQWMIRGGIPLSLVVLWLIPVLPIVIPFIFGKNFSPMVTGAQILLFAEAAKSFFFWLGPYYYTLGKFGTWSKGYALYTTIFLVLSWICVPVLGFWGIAIIQAIGEVVFLSSMTYVALRYRI